MYADIILLVMQELLQMIHCVIMAVMTDVGRRNHHKLDLYKQVNVNLYVLDIFSIRQPTPHSPDKLIYFIHLFIFQTDSSHNSCLHITNTHRHRRIHTPT